ncbi:MAG TPA: amidase family protein [Gemmatimonadaceae bacterium]|nr:amidase family protein [Gemmatimonadaceae bacterium]
MRQPILALLVLSTASEAAAQRAAFRIEEATISGVHAAFRSGTLTCRSLVQRYIDRIEAIDKKGPAINAIVLVNPKALEVADSLDRRYAREGLTGPLHCVPVIVKDNFETNDLQTTAGSLALKGWIPKRDATMVARIRSAGAIVLAKSNMAEWAFTPYETVSSILPGYTKNPYALDRVTAGSSGGTAAAVAASEGLVGLGTDTGNSIRGPSAHNALVGIRSTMGLTSRAGVVPLNFAADIAGPMTRTVADAVEVFNVVAGPDADDSVTALSAERREADYRAFIVKGGLKGARIGILRQAYETPTTDSQVVVVFNRALEDLRKAGATVVEARIDSLQQVLRGGGGCSRFRHDLETYFASRGEGAAVKTVTEIVRSRAFHPSVEVRLTNAMRDTSPPPSQQPGCRNREAMQDRLRAAVTALMDSLRLDALVYPTWSNPPRLIGDLNTPHGDNSQLFSPTTGFPAITVPMGYTRENRLPAGMTFFGRAWSEGRLITLAYGFEQATKHRRAPTFK